jgi:hypothetical protein
MKQADDNKTIDVLPPVKRGRGRPAGEDAALTPAQRAKAYSERLKASGRGFLKVELPVDLLQALDKFAANKDRAQVETKSEVVERVLRAYLLRKR